MHIRADLSSGFARAGVVTHDSQMNVCNACTNMALHRYARFRGREARTPWGNLCCTSCRHVFVGSKTCLSKTRLVFEVVPWFVALIGLKGQVYPVDAQGRDANGRPRPHLMMALNNGFENRLNFGRCWSRWLAKTDQEAPEDAQPCEPNWCSRRR